MKLSDLKPGDMVICRGCACLSEEPVIVCRDSGWTDECIESDLYVPCALGEHYLDSHADKDGELKDVELVK